MLKFEAVGAEHDRSIIGAGAVVRVVHAHGPEQLDPVLMAELDHDLQRVYALVQIRLDQVVSEAAFAGAEHLSGLRAVGEQREARTPGAIED